MKRIISLLLCLCMFISLLSGCTNDSKESDGDENGKQSEEQGGNSVNGLDISVGSENDVLSIAKKYYDFHTKAMDADLLNHFNNNAGTVSFDGKQDNIKKSVQLCSASSLAALFRGDGNYAVACAAAAVGWTPDYAQAYGELASILLQAGFVKDKDRMKDAKTLIGYAITLDPDDTNFYMILAQIYNNSNDTNGAINALDAALAITPSDVDVLTCKLNMLDKQGISEGDAAVESILTALKTNEGELSKRDTKQEHATQGMEEVTDEDSLEEALRKLTALCVLEPITPADMIEEIFPKEAQEVRENILELTEEDKNLNFLKFPSSLFPNARIATSDPYQIAIKEYTDSLNKYIRDVNSEIRKAEKAANQADADRMSIEVAFDPKYNPFPKYEDMTATDFMLDYNLQVLDEGIESFEQYKTKRYEKYMDDFKEIHGLLLDGWLKAEKYWDAHRGEKDARKVYEAMSNAAVDKFVPAFIDTLSDYYEEVKSEGQLFWECMLPFARCTLMSQTNIVRLYSTVIMNTIPVLNSVTEALQFGGRYFHDTYGVSQEMGDMGGEEPQYPPFPQYKHPVYDRLDGFITSVELGDTEVKIGFTKVEVEYVNNLAVRVAFDWKDMTADAGLGMGYKKKFSVNGLEKYEFSAKVYPINATYNFRKMKIEDVYFIAEAKGEAKFKKGSIEGGVETGGSLRISYITGDYEIESALKLKLKTKYEDTNLAGEHGQKLFKGNVVH